MKKQTNCPCYSGKLYEECCAPYHKGQACPNALTLMRSRYSAYALGLIDYIIQTTYDEPKDNAARRREIEQFSKNTEFSGLKIVHFSEDDEEAYVTFIAYLKSDQNDVSFTERSRFIYKDRWYYVDGVVAPNLQP